MAEDITAEMELNQDQPISSEVETPEEKMLKQSEVDKLIGRVKQEASQRAYERAKRELMDQQMTQQPTSQTQSMGGMPQQPQMSDEELNNRIARQIEEAERKAYSQKVAKDFLVKMQAGQSIAPDFNEKLATFNPADFPHLAELAAHFDNTPEIWYELSNNLHKVAAIDLLHQRSPNAAVAEMRKLSDSIRKNKEAAQQPEAREPLSQIKPSTVGTDNGSMSINDLRGLDWLRG